MENIRVESFLGNDKVIVGNKYTDLVLETLGKVYIKTGNNSRVLSDVLKLLDQVQESEIKSQTIIVGSLLEMEQMEYPGDGFFIYNTLTSTLYISYDERYIALIEAAEGADDGYVRRKGDTMTGQLEINTVGPPLIVASSKLVSNLNAEFINGYSSDDLAKKNVDEYIYGNWTFKGKGVSEDTWVFKDNVRMYGDLVTSRSLTSPDFMSGFGGYGWRLDANTNTLTVDYLVVRKAMRVYELVINKISATNGSIWVTNSSKCSKAVQPTILTDAQLRSIGTWTGSSENIDAMLKLLSTDGYYIPLPGNGANTLSTVTRTKEISKADSINTTPKTFVNYKFIIHVKDPRGLVNNTLFRGPQTLYDESLLTSTSSDQNHIAFRKCITLYYISMGMTVTKWGGNEGQWDEGTIPLEWTLTETFNKDTAFYMIPKGDKVATEDFEKNGFNSTYLTPIQPFYKYFGLDTTIVNQAIAESNSQFNSSMNTTVVMPNLWVVNTDDEEYPLFKPGDIIRCQKYTGGNIKYYDAIVMSQMESRQFIVQKATSVFDIYTEIHYNEDGSVASSEESYNNTQYSKTETSYDVNTGARKQVSSSNTTSDRLDDISEGDDMIQMGNIFNTERQGALYLTSSDDGGPYMDVITELNRPDYSVLYDVPLYDRKELIYKSTKHNYYYQESPSIEGAPTFTVDIKDGESVITKTYYCTEYPTQTSVIKMRDNKYRHSLTKTTKVRIGRLDGIYNEMFGKKQPYGYGLYGENVFLTGEFYLNNGQSIVDFSEENILLKFKNAGLEIKETLNDEGEKIPVLDENGEPVLDKDGNPVYETSISMNADKFYFYIGDKLAMTLGKMFNDDGRIQGSLLDVQGAVQSRGLYIKNKQGELTCIITEEGDLYARNAFLSGTVLANIGYLGGQEITISESSLSYYKYQYPYCKTMVESSNQYGIGGRLVDVFRYPSDESDTTLNDGVVFNESGYLTAYIGGFVVSSTSLESIPGTYDVFRNGRMSIYSGGSPWIGVSSGKTESGGTVQSRMGLNVLPISSGLQANFYAYNHYDDNPCGMIIDVKSNSGYYPAVGIKISAISDPGFFYDGKGVAIEAVGHIQCKDGYFLGKYAAPDNDGRTYWKGINEGRPEELPDLDDIRITVCNGLVVGWRYDK